MRSMDAEHKTRAERARICPEPFTAGGRGGGRPHEMMHLHLALAALEHYSLLTAATINASSNISKSTAGVVPRWV